MIQPVFGKKHGDLYEILRRLFATAASSLTSKERAMVGEPQHTDPMIRIAAPSSSCYQGWHHREPWVKDTSSMAWVLQRGAYDHVST